MLALTNKGSAKRQAYLVVGFKHLPPTDHILYDILLDIDQTHPFTCEDLLSPKHDGAVGRALKSRPRLYSLYESVLSQAIEDGLVE